MKIKKQAETFQLSKKHPAIREGIEPSTLPLVDDLVNFLSHSCSHYLRKLKSF